LAIFILVWAKVCLSPGIGLTLCLAPIITAFVLLAYTSPPIVVALFYSTDYLLGHISITHPGVSVNAVIAIVLVATLLLVRWKEGGLINFFQNQRQRFLAFSLIIIVLAIGFVGAFFLLSTVWLGIPADHSLSTAFAASMRNTNSLLHYVMLSHWLVFIALGILGCMRDNELKIFFAAFSIFLVAKLAALPAWYYPEFLERVYMHCEAMGLEFSKYKAVTAPEMMARYNSWLPLAGNVNRAYVGYMAVTASVVSLAMAHAQKNVLKMMWYSWWLFTSIVVFFAGSKGPALSWVIATTFVMLLAAKQDTVKSLTVFGITVSLVALSILLGKSLLPCGLVKQYTDSAHSFTTREAVIKESLGVVAPKESRVTSSPTRNWLTGSGFGASTRSVDSATGEVITHAGSNNLFVDLLLEVGIVGLTLFITAAGILIFGFFSNNAAERDSERKLLHGLMGGALLVLLVKVNVATETHTEDFAPLLLGILIGHKRFSTA
jgi:hypothetical protein